MKASITVAAALAAGMALWVAGSPAVAAGKNTNSEKVAKLLVPAQEAMGQKKWAEALSKIKEAEALPDKTPYDQHTITDFACRANVGAGNYAEAAKTCEAKLNDSFTTEAEQPVLVKLLMALNTQLKNYDKAIEFGQRAIKGGYATEDNKNTLAQVYYFKGDWKGALKTEEPLVDGEIKAGQTPKEDQLKILLNTCIKLEDAGCQQHALELMVTYYPKPDIWKQLLYTVRKDATGNDTATLQTYRLMSEVDVLTEAGDFNEAAQLALEVGSPGEAQKFLEKGFASNAFNDQRLKDRNTRLLDTVKKTAATDQASLPKTEKEADAAPTGAKDVGLGLAYLGYGQYDKSADFIAKGIAKGGVKNDAEAHLLLGIAQLKGGHKDEAVKSFKAVKGDPLLEKIANLWILHAKQA
jgi:tetratricopeptide (TPR) repeat protein